MGSRKTWAVMAAAAGVSLGLVGAAQAQSYTLQHTNSIDLTSLFNTSSGYGNNSLSIAFDGSSAYVGGYNNTSAAASVGIVKVENVMSVSPSAAGLSTTQFSANAASGLNALAYDSGSNNLVAAYDSGSTSTSFVERLQTDGTQVWQKLSPGGVRPLAMALDPKADSGNVAVGILSPGSSARSAIKFADGSSLYGTGTGASVATNPFSSSLWRGLAFDSAGNVAVSNYQAVGYGNRVNSNLFADLGGTSGQTTRSVLKGSSLNGVGNGVGLVEGLVPGADVVAFSPRVSSTGAATSLTLYDMNLLARQSNSGYIQLSNPDGTVTGLPQSTLVGNDDGIGSTFSTELKNFAVAKDVNGLPILLSISALEHRLDVYQMEPTYSADADGNWSATSNWMAGISPNAATLNARFGPTTAARTVTADTVGIVVKDLKFDSPNGYTLAGNAVTLSAPDGQISNMQVLQGTHTIQAPVTLTKALAVDVVAGGGLNVTSDMSNSTTGTLAVTKTGGGILTLGGNVATGGALTIAGGTLNVGGTMSASHITATGSTTTPAFLNVSGTLTVPADGTDAATSKFAATASVNITSTGKLDINNNKLVVDYSASSPADIIRGYLLAGRNGGTWNGAGGIVSSTAAADASKLTAIGYAEASDMGITTFGGQPTAATSLVLKSTVYGDANMDGVVNADDYALIDRGFLKTTVGAHWTDGDFNYDGMVDSSDYLLIDTSYGKETGQLSPTLLAQREAEFGPAYVSQLIAAVPEPTSLGLLGLSGLALLGRRRRTIAG